MRQEGPVPRCASGDRPPARPVSLSVRSGFSLLPGQRRWPLAIPGNNPISVWVQTDPFCRFPRWQNPLGGFGPSLPPLCSWPGEPRTCQAGLAEIPCCLCEFTLLLLSVRERSGARIGRVCGSGPVEAGEGPCEYLGDPKAGQLQQWGQWRAWGCCWGACHRGGSPSLCSLGRGRGAGGRLAGLARGVQPPAPGHQVQGAQWERGPGASWAQVQGQGWAWHR